MRIVMKFGGTSLGDGEKIKNAAKIIRDHLEKNEVIVVCSAMAGITDKLFSLVEKGVRGRVKDVETTLNEISDTHLKALDAALSNENLKKEVKQLLEDLFNELRRAVMSVLYLREVTPRSRDYIVSFGERLSTRIMWGALTELGVNCKYLDGGDAGIVTDSNFGEASPLMEITRLEVRRRLGSLLDRGITPIVTGYIAVNEEGVTTTLGRGGSDYTATILGYCLDVDEVWLWSDVDGLMTADPKIVKNAKVIPTVSFSEAIEMALFGAKNLHPRALEPALQAGIKVRIKNTFNPSAPGTLITTTSEKSGSVVKAVLLVKDVAMLTIRGASMVGRPGTVAKILETLARENINIMMISQSVSESSVSIVIKKQFLAKALSKLETALLGSKLVEDIEAEEDVCVVAVVGEGMRGTPGVASRVFGAVAKKGINIRMIAQGSSELNISFVVKDEDGPEAVRAI
ncbi:MAG: aspartate kinase, partial [Nitrososphaerota archaeon]